MDLLGVQHTQMQMKGVYILICLIVLTRWDKITTVWTWYCFNFSELLAPFFKSFYLLGQPRTTPF
jgi:hypothetical protein